MNDVAIKKAIVNLLSKGNAHTGFNEIVADIPLESVGKYVRDLPYSVWDLVEHMRIAQWDILQFSKSKNHQSPEWPNGYWVPKNHQPDKEEWQNSLTKFKTDRDEFLKLVEETEDLTKPFEWGGGQHLLQEALTLADHDAYHLGEILVLRRLLGNWKAV